MEKTFNDITIGTIMQIQNMDTTTLEGQKRLCEIIYGVNVDSMPLDEFLQMIATLPEVFNGWKKEFKPVVEVQGKEFVVKTMEQFTTKEFIDFDTLSDKASEQAPLLLSLMYSNEELDKLEYPENVKAKAQILVDMPAGVALGALDFFVTKLLGFVNNTVASSPAAKEVLMKDPKMKEAMEMVKRFLSQDGGGN